MAKKPEKLPPLDFCKKVFFIGVGATTGALDRVQDLVKELVSRGELNEKDGKRFTDELLYKLNAEKQVWEVKVKEMVDASVKNAVKSLGYVTREEYEQLKSAMSAMKGKPARSAPSARATAKPAAKKVSPAKKPVAKAKAKAKAKTKK